MKFSSAVCQPDDNPQAPFAARPSLGVPIDGDDGLSLCSRRHLTAGPRVKQGQPSQLRVLPNICFWRPSGGIGACLWREVVPRQRGKGLTRSRVLSALRVDDRSADWLLVDFARVRVLLLSAKHLFLATALP